jgi:hypothetical protein
MFLQEILHVGIFKLAGGGFPFPTGFTVTSGAIPIF